MCISPPKARRARRVYSYISGCASLYPHEGFRLHQSAAVLTRVVRILHSDSGTALLSAASSMLRKVFVGVSHTLSDTRNGKALTKKRVLTQTSTIIPKHFIVSFRPSLPDRVDTDGLISCKLLSDLQDKHISAVSMSCAAWIFFP